MFPLCWNLGNVGHWVVYNVCFHEKKLTYFNTINPESAWEMEKKTLERLWPRLLTGFRYMWFEAFPDMEPTFLEGPFSVEFGPLVKQPDYNCCGVMVMLFMEFWDGDLPGNLAEEMLDLAKIERLRKRITSDILLHPDNIRKDFVMQSVEAMVKRKRKPKQKTAEGSVVEADTETEKRRTRQSKKIDEEKEDEEKKVAKQTEQTTEKKAEETVVYKKESKEYTDSLAKQYNRRKKKEEKKRQQEQDA